MGMVESEKEGNEKIIAPTENCGGMVSEVVE